MRAVATSLILLAALVNLAPMIGVLSAERLQALYGIAFEDANLVVLMRHRALLLGIVGGLLVAGALRPGLRAASMAAGLVSMLSFVVIVWLVGGVNAQLQRVAWIDIGASALLAGAALLDRLSVEGRTIR